MEAKMAISNEQVELIGFETSYEFNWTARELMEKISDYAPSDAFLKARLKKTASGFEGILKVTSLSGTFLASKVGLDPQKLLLELGHVAIEQINKWSRNRTTLL
jgi:hypothetical protein